jgi:hypothetical protein
MRGRHRRPSVALRLLARLPRPVRRLLVSAMLAMACLLNDPTARTAAR